VGRIEIDLIAAYPPSGTTGHARAALEREQVRGIWTEFAAAWAGPARTDLTRLREAYEQLCQRRAPSAGVGARSVDADGVQCLRIGDNPQRVILFAHGGGFTLGSARGYLGAARTLAAAAEADVLVPDYRLAPEHPFPAGLDDLCSAHRWLLAQGTPAERIAFVGDGSGGGLILSALLALRDAGDALPTVAVCLSPWLDCTLRSPSMVTHSDRDPAMSIAQLAWSARAYLQGTEPTKPYVGPAFGDLRGLPPLLTLVGSEEVLLEENLRFADRARSHGVDARLHVGLEQTHAWPLFGSTLNAGRLAVDAVGRFIAGHCGWGA
jgi:acetyl esterase/lipase